jgi:cytoskeletal protein RodZ
MSLINDALKKAENMKGRGTAGPPAFPGPNKSAGENTGPSHEATMASMRAPRKSGPPQGLILGLVGAFFLIACGVLGVGVYLIFFRTAAETAVAQLDTSILDTSAPAVVEQPAQATATSEPTETETAATATIADETTPAPEATPTATSTVDPERRAAVTASAAETGAESDPAIADWVATLTITGVRTGEHSKVLVNNRVYSPGDTINYDFNLKLTDVTPTTLTFTDPNGAVYHLDL